MVLSKLQLTINIHFEFVDCWWWLSLGWLSFDYNYKSNANRCCIRG